MDELESVCDMGEESRETPTSALEWLLEYGSSVTINPAYALRNFAESHEDPDAFIAALASGDIEDEHLAEITGQFRYLDDVSTSRIVAVEYVKPWWPNLLDWQVNEGDAELGEALDEAGWNVLDIDEVYNFSLSPVSKNVYRRRQSKAARIEYHGTSYLNLIRAAPELDLPAPPSPYR